MAIQSSGAISLSDLQTEFGGSNPISLSEYYQNASPDLVTENNTNVPNTGNSIDLSDFYGATLAQTVTYEIIGGVVKVLVVIQVKVMVVLVQIAL